MRLASQIVLLVLTLLAVPNGERAARIAAQEQAVILWTGKATWTQRHTATQDEVTFKWTRTVTLDFSVDNRRKLDPKTLQMFHGLSGSWTTPERNSVTARHEGSPDADMRQVLRDQIDHADVQMSIKTCAPELSATAEGVSDNTFVLSVVATPRIVLRVQEAGQTLASVPAQLEVFMKAQFPYRYDQAAHDPPEAEVSQVESIGSALLPTGAGPGAGLAPVVPAKMKVTLRRKALTLEYTPLDRDMLGHPDVTILKDLKRITNNYAAGPGGQFVHGNNQLRVLVEGQDVSQRFLIVRFMRDWLAQLDQQGSSRTGAYAGDGWREDTVGRPSWIDIPGELLAMPSRRWPRQRYMQEYLVAVQRFPEFGLLYFTVVIDTIPNGYRVRMYPARKITAEQWCQIKRLKRPYQEETSSGTAAVDSGWQKVP